MRNRLHRSNSCPSSIEKNEEHKQTYKQANNIVVLFGNYSNSSSKLFEVVGVAGFESCESDATVTILGEPRSSSTSSSMSSVVMMVSAAPPFLFWWVLMCFDKWSLRMNLLEHSGHSNLFSPEQNRDDCKFILRLYPDYSYCRDRCVCACTCVCPAMSLKLVAPGKAFPAKDPVTDKRSLSRVPAQVSSQMGRLTVDLSATLHVTHVLLLFGWIAVVSIRKAECKNHRLEICVHLNP